MREIDLERYELFEAPAYRFEPETSGFELQRRDFFKFLGGGLVLLLTLDGVARAQESGRAPAFRPDARPPELAAWLHVGEDGTVTVFTGKVEVGQNIRTSLAQAVAEELHAPLGSVQLVMADTDLTPYDMGTFGSRTTPVMAHANEKGRRGGARSFDRSCGRKVERGSGLHHNRERQGNE